MSEVDGINEPPEILLLLEIDSSLNRALDIADQLNQAIRQEISRRIVEVMKDLGIPGVLTVQIGELGTNSNRPGQFLRVHVNGLLCRYPHELFHFIYSYLTGDYPAPGMTLSEILDWLSEAQNDGSDTASVGHQRMVEFLSLACLSIIKLQPAVLLRSEQVAAYLDLLPFPPDNPDFRSHTLFQDSTRLCSILREVIDLKISIADHQAVIAALWEARERSTEDLIEYLVSALHPDQIEIRFPLEYLKQLTRDNDKNGTNMFSYMREGLFEELGLTYPKFRFTIADELKPDCFAFRINHLTTLPLMGLRPGQCLVNDTADRLQLQNIKGKVTVNPATGQPASIIDLREKDLVEKSGLTTWDQMGYLILSFAQVLRKNSFCFIHQEAVQNQLNQLEWGFPAIVKAVRTQASGEQLTRVLRALVAEEISIRNLRPILERLLEYDYSFSDSHRYLILDDRPTAFGQLNAARRGDPINLVSFLRSGMKRQISNKHARGSNTIVVYLLDLQIEESLLASQSVQAGEKVETRLGDDVIDNILEAIRQEVAVLPPTAQRPSILTSIAVRHRLRQVIATEFPRIHVVAYQELAPGLNVQPIARISLNT